MIDFDIIVVFLKRTMPVHSFVIYYRVDESYRKLWSVMPRPLMGDGDSYHLITLTIPSTMNGVAAFVSRMVYLDSFEGPCPDPKLSILKKTRSVCCSSLKRVAPNEQP